MKARSERRNRTRNRSVIVRVNGPSTLVYNFIHSLSVYLTWFTFDLLVSLEDIQDSVTSSLATGDSSANGLVEEFMEVTQAPRGETIFTFQQLISNFDSISPKMWPYIFIRSVEMAVCLLQKCEQNLQVAVNIFLENLSSCNEGSTPSNPCVSMDVDDVQNIAASPCPVVKTPSQCCDMESDAVTINGGTGKSNETRQANATQFTFSD
jgi:hypothetical protein